MKSRLRNPLFLLPLLCACGTSGRAVETPFVGRWRAATFSIEVPAACMRATVEFSDSSTFATRSGEQVLTAKYAVERQGPGFLLKIGNLKSNGRPNCQGIPAEYVLEHHVSEMYLETIADTMRVRVGPDQFSSMVRIR